MQTQTQNQEIVLAARPNGVPTRDTFGIRDIAMPELADGALLIKSIYVSVDPGMRGFMDKGDSDAAGTKYELNKPITSRTVAQVVASNSGTLPWVISFMVVSLGRDSKASLLKT